MLKRWFLKEICKIQMISLAQSKKEVKDVSKKIKGNNKKYFKTVMTL